MRNRGSRRLWPALLAACLAVPAGGETTADAALPLPVPVPAPAPAPAQASAAPPPGCLPSGDGYLRARVAGAIDFDVDWPNSGTRCEGEPRDAPPGVRMSFHRISGAAPDLLFVFGLSGIREGRPARAVGANLTVIVQSTGRIYSTLGDHRCTVDSLEQTPLPGRHAFRIEAHGFCTQPAHAVRGTGDVLVNTFDFAGQVVFDQTEGGS
jgi:hypothetical protein